jgi:hypothetical protein
MNKRTGRAEILSPSHVHGRVAEPQDRIPARGVRLAQNWQFLFALLVALVDALALFVGYKLSGASALEE